MQKRYWWLGLAVAGTVAASACNDSSDHVQKNPHFSTGATANTSSGGENGFALGGGSDVTSGGGTASAEGGAPGTTSGGDATDGGNATAGAPAEQPPYDCVLHPKTHLEIINACTDATRIEKHPALPAIP